MRAGAALVVAALMAGSAPNPAWSAGLTGTRHLRPHAAPSTLSQAQIRPSAPVGGGQSNIVEALTPAMALDVAKEWGLAQAELTTNDDKTMSVFGKSNGVDIELSLGECNPTCSAEPALFADFGKQPDVDSKFINAYNRENRLSMYVDEDGDLAMSLTLYLQGGVTRQHLVAVGKIFLDEVRASLDFKPN